MKLVELREEEDEFLWSSVVLSERKREGVEAKRLGRKWKEDVRYR